MLFSETRLIGFVEVVIRHVFLELVSHSDILLRNGRLDIGQNFLSSSVSRLGDFRMGVTEAVLKEEGTKPDTTEELIMSTIRGHRAGKHAFSRAQGMGSREHVEGFVSETNLVT